MIIWNVKVKSRLPMRMSVYSENWHTEVELWLKNLMHSRCRQEIVYILKKIWKIWHCAVEFHQWGFLMHLSSWCCDCGIANVLSIDIKEMWKNYPGNYKLVSLAWEVCNFLEQSLRGSIIRQDSRECDKNVVYF